MRVLVLVQDYLVCLSHFTFTFHIQKRLALKLTGYNQSPAGHYQPFIHLYVTRPPSIGIAKMSEVFMNGVFNDVGFDLVTTLNNSEIEVGQQY